MASVRIEPLLPRSAKPSRYIDHEINAVRKAWQPVNVCFAYPDVYEVGVSHLGIKILYSIVNSLDGIMADRTFLPWLDMLELMRREGLPLFGLESRRELKDFDLLGITLQSELTYTNILEMLDIAGIPVHANARDGAQPIIMAGGPCATNPLPLADFIDVFFLGEAEEAILEIARIFQTYNDRAVRLGKLASVEGCFVPALHWGKMGGGWKVKLRKFAGFSESNLLHTPQLLSWQLATHNRCVAEIMRGCSRGCRFCHAGYFYRPVRERPPDLVLREILQEVEASGWDEAGLLSLSSSDYSCLKGLLKGLLEAIDTDKTHVALPSLRVDSLDAETVELMRKLGREGLTIAPEAGSQRLRDVINKNLSEAGILDGVRTALQLGWQKVKLYFMIGLPTETDEDIAGIIDLIAKISAAGYKRMQINVTLSPFVPKPFTPFQWAAMLPAEELLQRCLLVKQAFARQRNIKIKYHTIENSLLEAVFARGDRRLGELLYQAWRLGARFDGWNECFDWSRWEEAFPANGIDISDYLREPSRDADLPWDFIDTGVTRDFLLAELQKAERGETTPDCRESCASCGVCGPEIQTVIAGPIAMAAISSEKKPKSVQAQPIGQPYRYRIFYSKTGLLRFISHLDWMRMLFRLISKAPLETVFTQGFSPHPRVSLCPPLPLGVESECEFFDIAFRARHSSEEIIAALNRSRIEGFSVLRCEVANSQSALPSGEEIVVAVPKSYIQLIHQALEHFAAEQIHSFTKRTETRTKDYDLKRIILDTSWQGNQVTLFKSLASPGLYDVLAELFQLDKPTLYTLDTSRRGWLFS